MEIGRITRGKKLIIGLDEAGYGPNLGPLVIGGSAWLTPEGFSEADFCAAFEGAFSTIGWSEGCTHIPLGDSKKLYQSGSGLTTLEVGLLSMLEMLHRPTFTLAEAMNFLKESSSIQPLAAETSLSSNSSPELTSVVLAQLPWYENLSAIQIPHSEQIDRKWIAELSTRAAEVLASQKIQLVSMKAMVINEPEFNYQVRILGSKGALLSKATLLLAGRLLDSVPGVPATIFCDRQGGRKNYLPQLLDWMPDRWFVETQQTSSRCSYSAEGQPAMDIHFSVGGDTFPATALASMVAKYLRERLMESFNKFWQEQVQGIKATAGYPEDAKRFRKEILLTAHKLALDEEYWWRCR